jgi:hypothetical protein
MNEYNNFDCRCELCQKAWAEWYGKNKIKRGKRLGSCAMPDCEEPGYARGLCHVHYERLRSGRKMDAPINQKPRAWKYRNSPEVMADDVV